MTNHRKTDYRLRRLDANRLELRNDYGIPVRIFANDGVPIERAAVDELLGLLELQETIARMLSAAPELFDGEAGVEAVSLSSDFHRGAGIPIGTTLKTRGVAVPQAVGTDVNCGMRVHLTGLTYDQVAGRLDALEQRVRHIFFQGGRQIGLTATQREAMLAEGIPGLLQSDALKGDAWLAAADELNRINGGGGAPTEVPVMFTDYVRGSGGAGGVSYDTQIGSLGGGNHFLEYQKVGVIHDRATAHAWGLREGQVVIMVHTGSLGLGHTASAIGKEAMRALLPSGVAAPRNGITVLPLGERSADALTAVRAAIMTASNFAFSNRFHLARMAIRALEAEIGEVDASLLWDAPHNLLWEEEDGVVVHRKGSTPARGAEAMANTPFPWGEPVIVPGSMGAPSFILRSLGNPDALYSACHGAGRALSRGDAQRGHDEALDEFLARFRVVTPIDPRQIRGRADLIEAWRQELKQEAPFAYKNIGPIVDTLQGAQVATPVVELHPIMTVKG
jgi:tRNA-splicing ligase RtcB